MNYLLWLEDRRLKKTVDLKALKKKKMPFFSLLDFSLNTNTPLLPVENLWLFAEPVVPKKRETTDATQLDCFQSKISWIRVENALIQSIFQPVLASGNQSAPSFGCGDS